MLCLIKVMPIHGFSIYKREDGSGYWPFHA
jgi:hypothetical protein